MEKYGEGQKELHRVFLDEGGWNGKEVCYTGAGYVLEQYDGCEVCCRGDNGVLRLKCDL